MTNAADPPRRINISVEVLEERLRNWADSIKQQIDQMMADLKQRDDRYDNQIGDLMLWRTQYQIEFKALQDEVTKLTEVVTAIDRLWLENNIAFKAKIGLLKSGWTWIVAGAFGASAIIGLLINLKIINL